MMTKQYTPEDVAPTPLNVSLRNHIVRDLQMMEKNTKIPIDELVTKAVMMFIATHGDYLGTRK